MKEAVAKRDPQLAASLWTENAIFIDESGEETLGRNALQHRFDSLFQERQETLESSIEFETERITPLSEKIALVVGVVIKRNSEESVAATRFSMVLEKQKEGWLIAQATETRIASNSAYHNLCELAWLIGDWKAKTASGSAAVKAEWAPGKNFIDITSTITSQDSEKTSDRQVIGWDERGGHIVSWFFGHRGNFSTGRWKHDGDKWLVEVSGTRSDGTDLKSTDVYLPTNGQFLWQSTNRSSAGMVLPDTDKLTVEKISGGMR